MKRPGKLLGIFFWIKYANYLEQQNQELQQQILDLKESTIPIENY